jgi:hypothetical protein
MKDRLTRRQLLQHQFQFRFPHTSNDTIAEVGFLRTDKQQTLVRA